MKRLGIWFALFLVTAFSVVIGWNWHRLNPLPQTVNASFQQPLLAEQGISDSPLIVPQINPDRLLNDLEALSFVRYTEADRRRARSYIEDELQKSGWRTRSHLFNGGVNIVAERPGTDPNAGAILLGAHYDTVERSPGADDNASAVSALLETARLLGPTSTLRSLRIAVFDLEEAGLVGSFAITDSPEKMEDLEGAVILEMLGYACHTAGCQQYPSVLPIEPPSDTGNFLAVIGDQGHMPLIDSFTQSVSRSLPPIFTLPVPLLGPFTPDLLRSDHAPFWKKGIGAVMVTDTANFRNPHYHLPSDTPANIDRPFFTGSTQLVVNAMTRLLNSRGSLDTTTASLQKAPTRTVPVTRKG